LLKAALNILISVCACVFAVWIGLLAGRGLFSYSGGVIRWMGWIFPYALVVVNALVAFLIGLVAALLIYKSSLSEEYRAALLIVIVGMFATLSSLYVVLYLIEEGHQFEKELNMMLSVFLGNALLCGAAIWGGLLLGKQI